MHFPSLVRSFGLFQRHHKLTALGFAWDKPGPPIFEEQSWLVWFPTEKAFTRPQTKTILSNEKRDQTALVWMRHKKRLQYIKKEVESSQHPTYGKYPWKPCRFHGSNLKKICTVQYDFKLQGKKGGKNNHMPTSDSCNHERCGMKRVFFKCRIISETLPACKVLYLTLSDHL